MNRFLCVLALAAAGCATKAPPAPEVSAAPRWGMLVSTADLAGMAGEGDLVVVHVARERKSYDGGHLPGARFLPFRALSVKRDGVSGMLPDGEGLGEVLRRAGIGPDTRAVFYDDAEGTWAARAWVAMDLLGAGGRAALLDGQLARWKAEGRPLETAAAAGEPAAAPPGTLDPSRLVDGDLVRAMSAEKCRAPDAPIALLDARPPGEFSGAKPGKEVARPGHIPGAVNLPAERLVASPGDPVLRPPADLTRLLEEAGAREGDLLVAHCRTARAASLLYFAARLLGRPVVLYDGSFLGWQRDPTTPVAR